MGINEYIERENHDSSPFFSPLIGGLHAMIDKKN